MALQKVEFEWDDQYGRCYECGLPAAFFRGATDDELAALEVSNKLCAVCAANAACEGESIGRLEDEEHEVLFDGSDGEHRVVRLYDGRVILIDHSGDTAVLNVQHPILLNVDGASAPIGPFGKSTPMTEGRAAELADLIDGLRLKVKIGTVTYSLSID